MTDEPAATIIIQLRVGQPLCDKGSSLTSHTVNSQWSSFCSGLLIKHFAWPTDQPLCQQVGFNWPIDQPVSQRGFVDQWVCLINWSIFIDPLENFTPDWPVHQSQEENWDLFSNVSAPRLHTLNYVTIAVLSSVPHNMFHSFCPHLHPLHFSFLDVFHTLSAEIYYSRRQCALSP